MQKKISASMMCADIIKIADTLAVFEKNRVEYLHIDIMDGSFVPNFTLGTDYCTLMKKNSCIPLDIHLMIDNPENKLDWFNFGEEDYVSVHCESTKHLQRALQKIRQKGGKPMVAVNPATPLAMLENVLDDIDGVLVMSVNPGFAGQKLVPKALDKIKQLREYLNKNGYEQIEIEVDGNISMENASLMSNAGANIFVAGTSSIFTETYTLEEGILRLREAIQ
ncbi:MAG: ribulose-phosphate 3-epimerase [Bacillota bacterium]|nr:ribulose-phosphate 3-epimerase [Bacillota bacterium]